MTQSSSEIRHAYDLAAKAYADSFRDELLHKPRDLELLKQFAQRVGRGQRVLDLGCGPGHTTAHLGSLGLRPTGLDLSPKMVAKATAFFPDLDFAVGDFFELPDQDASASGILAFYCIVHLQRRRLTAAFREMLRVLKPGGTLFLAFHAGSEVVVQEDFLDSGARLEFFAFPIPEVQVALQDAGFIGLEVHEREPYESEYPSRRAYLFASRPRGA